MQLIRGALFTFGILGILAGVFIGGAMVLGGGMSDAPQEGEETAAQGMWVGGVGIGAGLVLILLAVFL